MSQPPHPPYRPSPTRAATMGPNPFSKSRATSQPAGERSPAPPQFGGSGSHPDSGRGSPAGMFGVIGGSRTPKGVAGTRAVGMPPTRASSFSVADGPTRNASLARTLSSHQEENTLSRTHSTSPYPTFSPSSSPATSPSVNPAALPGTPPKLGMNPSRSRSQSFAVGARPIAGGRAWPMSTLENTGTFARSFDPGWSDPIHEGSNMSPFTRNIPGFPSNQAGRFGAPVTSYPSRGFTSTWGSSAPDHPPATAKPLGSTGLSTIVGGFGEPSTNGNRSGTSSRRHSVSVVGGPGGRRDLFSDGLGMTSPPGRGLGPSGFSDADLLHEKLDNALNITIDESRKRGVEIEVGKGQQIPAGRFGGEDDYPRGSSYGANVGFGSSPARGRLGAPVDELKPGSLQSRFDFGQARAAPAASPGRAGGYGVPGAIGTTFAPDLGYNGMSSRQAYNRQGPPSPVLPTSTFGRPPQFNPYGGARPPSQGFTSPNYGQPQTFPPPQQQQQGFGYYPQQGSPPQPTSPSFSQLSLSDLGRGLPLAQMPQNAPLYIVVFKAGRRDVFYCPDPTLLITVGDRVIVEADRGSDLGTVVYDSLTPVEVRDWQEKQATAALLSGAREHQPPGLAMGGFGNKPPVNRVAGGELAGADLSTLLAGVGGGQMDSPMGSTAQGRGPLAKEIMPKRIFAKSAQGPEEQERVQQKLRDEQEALYICREKVVQRGLPMTIVDAEYQWDRRKLTFYFKADKRIDFRDLTKENFRIFKSRIWMAMVPKDDPRN